MKNSENRGPIHEVQWLNIRSYRIMEQRGIREKGLGNKTIQDSLPILKDMNFQLEMELWLSSVIAWKHTPTKGLWNFRTLENKRRYTHFKRAVGQDLYIERIRNENAFGLLNNNTESKKKLKQCLQFLKAKISKFCCQPNYQLGVREE